MTNTFRLLFALLMVSAFSFAQAAAVALTEKADIAVSPSAVWAATKDFGNLQSWHPAFVGSTNTNGNQPGSVRVLDLGGPTITEELVRFSDEHKNFTYKITQVDPSVLPLENYISWFAVRDNGSGGSSVIWMGHFNTIGDAPAADVEKGVRGVYRAGLDNLKSMLETPTAE